MPHPRIHPLPLTANQRVKSAYGLTKPQMLAQLRREIACIRHEQFTAPTALQQDRRRSVLHLGPTAQFESAKTRKGKK